MTSEFSDALQMYKELILRGIPPMEARRAVLSYFEDPPPYALDWPGPVVGIDLAGRIDPIIVPDTGVPTTNFNGMPQNTEPYPTDNYSTYGIGGDFTSFFSPSLNSTATTSDAYSLQYFPYTGDTTNWSATASQTNSEPSMHGEHGHTVTLSIPPWRYDIEQTQMNPINIPPIIIPPSGVQEYIYKLQEAISELRKEFRWITPDYIEKAKLLGDEAEGQLYLIRAAGETITDHRGEGEEFRRKLSGEELNSMSRTAIGKGMDINHNSDFQTQAVILDAEYDPIRKEIQMLVLEKDPTINEAVEDGIITAVSINGGAPRNNVVDKCDNNCTGGCELCTIPKGVVLGELDGIGMTWVVTNPRGLAWNGNHIPKAEPGVKFTKIEAL